MIAKRFKLPHDEQAIAKVTAERDRTQAEFAKAQDALNKVRAENAEAERAEEVRKAQVMTLAMVDLLQWLADGGVIKARCSYFHPPTYHYDDTMGKKINRALLERLKCAQFVGHDSRLTKAGRAALGAYAAEEKKRQGL